MSLIFIGSNPKKGGGIQTFGRNLKLMFNDELNFLALSDKGEDLYEVQNIYEGFSKNCLERIMNKFFPKLRFAGLFNKYKVFILNTPMSLRYFKFECRRKKILVQHQTADLYWGRKDYLGKNIKLLERVQNEIDFLVTLSPYDRDEFIKNFNLKEDKVIFIRHTTHMPLLEVNKEKNKNIIMVCRLYNDHKRLDLAINAMKKIPDFTLNIFGSGPDEKMLKDLAEELNNVVFHGSTNKVQEKLDKNGIYVMTSDYEGYPISLVEALRRGLPIILRNTFTSAQDVVQGNGVLLEDEWNEDKFIDAVKITYEKYADYSEKSILLGKRHDFKVIEKEWKGLISNLGGS